MNLQKYLILFLNNCFCIYHSGMATISGVWDFIYIRITDAKKWRMNEQQKSLDKKSGDDDDTGTHVIIMTMEYIRINKV